MKQKITKFLLAKKRAIAILVAGLVLLYGASLLVDPVSSWVASTSHAACDGLGLQLGQVYLTGANRADKDAILHYPALQKDRCIFAISLDELKEVFLRIDWVKNVAIERSLPSTLHIFIEEHVPFAIWQHKSQLHLIATNGDVITQTIPKEITALPLLVGEEANMYTRHIIRLLAAEESLVPYISSIIRVGKRRWNIRTPSNIEIKLPEEGVLEAWKYLAQLHAEKQILDREIKVIDLRVDGKLYIEPADGKK